MKTSLYEIKVFFAKNYFQLMCACLLMLFVSNLYAQQQVPLIPYRLDTLWGYADTNGKVVIKPVFQYAEFFKGDLAKIVINQKAGYINSKGEYVFTPDLKYSWYFPQYGVFKVSDEGGCSFGYFNKSRDTIVALKYGAHNISSPCEGNIILKKDSSYQLFSVKGKKIKDLKYSSVGLEMLNLNDNSTPELLKYRPVIDVIRVTNGKKVGYIDCMGNEIIPPVYDDCRMLYNQNIWLIKLSDKYGVTNSNRVKILDIVFDEITEFNDTLLLAKKNGKYGILKKNGKEYLKFEIDEIRYRLDDNSRLIIVNKKFGVLNQQGRIIIPAIYDSLSPIYNNRYIVWKENKIGVIDSLNKEVIPVKYIADTTQRYFSFGYDIGHLREGLIPTSFNGKYGYIFDKSFKEAIPFIYDYANEFYNGLAEVKINNKTGIINKKGKEVIPVKYDSINKYSENFYSVRVGTKYGFVDLKGHEFFNDN